MNKLLPDRSFMRDGTQMLWQELTGESIRKQAFWTAYKQHVERRNPAVHGKIFGFPSGEPIGKEDAEASIEAARAMTTYLLDTHKRVMDELVTDNRERMAEEDGWRALRLISPRPATPASECMARAVTELREERGLTVDDLAAASKFHPRSITRIESGLTEPSLTMLVPLSKALRVSIASLIERAGLDSIGDDTSGTDLSAGLRDAL